MPFVSQAQRRACWAKRDPRWNCAEWQAHTPDSRSLPERAPRAKATRKSKKRTKRPKLGGRQPVQPVQAFISSRPFFAPFFYPRRLAYVFGAAALR